MRLVVCQRPIGPAVFSILRPVILLPQSLVTSSSADQLEPILAHELVHLRRGDTVVGLLQLLGQSLWWFHPLVWWANRKATCERERCCDEEVVAAFGFEPADYAQRLLDVLQRKHELIPLRAFPGLRA